MKFETFVSKKEMENKASSIQNQDVANIQIEERQDQQLYAVESESNATRDGVSDDLGRAVQRGAYSTNSRLRPPTPLSVNLDKPISQYLTKIQTSRSKTLKRLEHKKEAENKCLDRKGMLKELAKERRQKGDTYTTKTNSVARKVEQVESIHISASTRSSFLSDKQSKFQQAQKAREQMFKPSVQTKINPKDTYNVEQSGTVERRNTLKSQTGERHLVQSRDRSYDKYHDERSAKKYDDDEDDDASVVSIGGFLAESYRQVGAAIQNLF